MIRLVINFHAVMVFCFAKILFNIGLNMLWHGTVWPVQDFQVFDKKLLL